MTPPFVLAKNLTKTFGTETAVSDLNFQLSIGETVGLLGENGAGKTTTFRMLAGSLGQTSGEVLINGEPLLELRRDIFCQIGYLPEHATLYPEMTALEYLRFRAELKLLGKQREKRIEEVSAICELKAMLHKRCAHLSKGYQRRLMLADALLTKPALLLLDEPTAGLDPNQVLHFRALLKELKPRHAILLSTHILEEVEATCDRALVLSHGKLVAEGSLEDLRAQAGSLPQSAPALHHIFARLTRGNE